MLFLALKKVRIIKITPRHSPKTHYKMPSIAKFAIALTCGNFQIAHLHQMRIFGNK